MGKDLGNDSLTRLLTCMFLLLACLLASIDIPTPLMIPLMEELSCEHDSSKIRNHVSGRFSCYKYLYMKEGRRQEEKMNIRHECCPVNDQFHLTANVCVNIFCETMYYLVSSAPKKIVF